MNMSELLQEFVDSTIKKIVDKKPVDKKPVDKKKKKKKKKIRLTRVYLNELQKRNYRTFRPGN